MRTVTVPRRRSHPTDQRGLATGLAVCACGSVPGLFFELPGLHQFLSPHPQQLRGDLDRAEERITQLAVVDDLASDANRFAGRSWVTFWAKSRLAAPTIDC